MWRAVTLRDVGEKAHWEWSLERMTDIQFWFLQLQRQLTDKVGEPVLLTIKMPFDEWFEVEVQTFTDRWGVAANREVDAAIEAAAEMLLEMDKVIAEITARTTLIEE